LDSAPDRTMSGPAFSLFISDLHLTPERPLPVQLLQRFIEEIVPAAQALYILGDFFEAWVGDDSLEQPFNKAICQSLNSVSAAGVPMFFLPGNRDFLVGQQFANAGNLTLLSDPTQIDLYGVPTLIAHGDQFCTDDTAYQSFRQQVREPAWQQQFLAQPMDQRLALAASLRERSEQAKADKKPDIMDVNQSAIANVLNGSPIQRLIHGHTHRPARHVSQANGAMLERWVLPDWYDSGGYLVCDAAGCRLVSFS